MTICVYTFVRNELHASEHLCVCIYVCVCVCVCVRVCMHACVRLND